MRLIEVNPGLIFWMIITFGLLFLILKKFAWPVILKALKDREEQIEKALNAAEIAKRDIEDIHLKNQALLNEVKEERDNILRDARLASEKMMDEARLKADSEADRIIETARQTINYEKLQAITDLKNQVAYLSIEIAEKVLKHELADQATVEKTIKEQIKDITLN